MVSPGHWMSQIYHGTVGDCEQLPIGWHRMHMSPLDGHPEHFKGTARAPVHCVGSWILSPTYRAFGIATPPPFVQHSVCTRSPPSMDTYNYPGKGLSLSQLVFALKEELKRAVDSPSYVTKHYGKPACEVLINDTSTSSTASPSTTFLNSIGMLRLRWQTSASGGTPSFTSTAFRWMSFPSSPPIFSPRRTVSVPVMYAVIGVGPSFNTPHYGPVYSLQRARPT